MATMTATEEKTITDKHYLDWPNEAGFNAFEDHRTKTELKVTGTIPSYAAGVLLRTGPGGYKVPRQDRNGDIETSHWFDGFTTTHRFDIGQDGKVSYLSYCQVDELIENVRKTGRREEATFGQKRDPCDGLFKKIKTAFTPSSSNSSPHHANIGVVLRDTMPAEREKLNTGTDRKIMTLTTDTASVKQFDMETLEPLGVTSQTVLHPSLVGPLSAAHAAHDPVNGDIFNYNLQFGAKPTYRVFRASPTTGDVDILATISGNDIKGSYLHSMMLSDNFVILCIWNAHYQMAGASILWNRNLLDAIQKYNPNDTALWVVIDRRHGRGVVKKFTTPAFFCFHTVNAWEESGAEKDSVDIACELVEHDNLDILHSFYYNNMVSNGSNVDAWNKSKRSRLTGGLARYKLASVPLSGAAKVVTAKAEKILHIPFPDSGDLPRINPNYVFKQHRYTYGIIDRQLSSFIDAIGKTDTVTKQCVLWQTPKHTPGEPIFIPRPGAVEEDDGVILTVVLDGQSGQSYLLCLDARNMEEIARADVGHPVGLGFHGAFLASRASL